MNTLTEFCLKASEQDIRTYTMIAAATHRHYNSEWTCFRMNEDNLKKYRDVLLTLIDKYKLNDTLS
jgi:hypothetical protein